MDLHCEGSFTTLADVSMYYLNDCMFFWTT
jgi:hypothetical protein